MSTEPREQPDGSPCTDLSNQATVKILFSTLPEEFNAHHCVLGSHIGLKWESKNWKCVVLIDPYIDLVILGYNLPFYLQT